MEKTTTINLGGNAFVVDEVAYQKLKNYLESVKKNIELDVDKNEVMADIEMSIAEKLKQKTLDKKIVTLADVEELITIMGHPEDFCENSAQQNDSLPDKIKKKLFRNTDDIIIGGVCSGLAIYFDVEPVLVRLAAFLLVFCNGIGIPVYILLWIIIPAAETKSQKLEMKGNPLTVASIEQSFKENEKESKHPIITAMGNIFRQTGKILKRVLQISAKILLFFINFSIIAFSLLAIIGMTIFVAAAVLYTTGGYMFDNVLISDIAATMPFYLFLFSLFCTIVIPAFLLLSADIMIAFRRKIVNIATIITLIVVWMVSSIIVGTIIIRYAPDIRAKLNDVQYRQTAEIPNINNFQSITADGKKLIISLKKGDKFSIVANGMPSDLENVSYSVDENSNLNIILKKKEIRQKCLFCDQKLVRVSITAPNIKNIKIIQSDLTLQKITADEIVIDAIDADNIVINGSIDKANITTTNSYLNLSGQFGNLFLETNRTKGILDIDSNTADIRLHESTRAKIAGSVEEGKLVIDDDSTLDGADFNLYDGTMIIEKNSWAISKFLNTISTNIDESSGLFYIGNAEQKNLANAPFATFAKLSKIATSEYKSNQDKDNYFQFYDNYYKLDIDNANSEQYREMRELLRDKF